MDNYTQARMAAIYGELQALAMKHDSKLLAVVMLTYGAQMLQSVQSAGLMTAEDAVATAAEATKDVGTSLPKNEKPQVVAIDGTDGTRVPKKLN